MAESSGTRLHGTLETKKISTVARADEDLVELWARHRHSLETEEPTFREQHGRREVPGFLSHAHGSDVP